MADERDSSKLEPVLSTPLLTGYGVGTILGAGIFVVIGEVIGEAGILAPLAYCLAALIAVTTASSYAEMGSRIPSAGGPIDYTETAFRSRRLGSATGWALLVAQVVSAATITTGFIDYLGVFVAVPDVWVVTGLVCALATIAIIGPKQSAVFMTATTTVGAITLVAVIVATADGLVHAPVAIVEKLSEISWQDGRTLFAAAFLAVYSFVGFGDMAMTAEETKNVRKTLPRSILASLAIVFVFYFAVSLSVVGAAHVDDLASAEAPLVKAVTAQGWPMWPVAAGSLFVIVNGALTQMITGSRLLFDLSRHERGAPGYFSHVAEFTRTPIRATVAVALVVLTLALLIPLKALAEMTSFVILIVFALVNAGLVMLKRREQPDSVPDIPMFMPAAGALFCGAALIAQGAFVLLGNQ